MKLKKIFAIIMLGIILLTGVNVKAKEIYSNGIVTLTEKEYNFVKEFYGINYFYNMTIEDYKFLKQMEINNGEIEIKKLEKNQIKPNNTSILSDLRNLSIAKSCQSNYCNIIISSQWFENPSVRSYEVIGARFQGISLYNSSITTRVKSSSGTTTETSFQGFSNGIGSSIELPTGNDLVVQQLFKVRKGGIVFGSYQHAIKNISLATSKSYYISITGYGNVFTFTASAVGSYDGFAGVNIEV